MAESKAGQAKPNKRARHEKTESRKTASKKKAVPVVHDEETVRKAIGRLSRETGLSGFMLDVLSDMLEAATARDESNMTITDVVCPNPNIVALNQATLEKHRTDMILARESSETAPQQKQQNVTDDAVRKYIVAQYEKKLNKQGVMVAGSNMHARLPLEVQDQQMIEQFLGYGETSTGYYVYMYYTGPDGTFGQQYQKDLRNWHLVPRTHLVHFHRHLSQQQLRTQLLASSDQVRALQQKYPSYDPRFALHKWLESKEGKQHKQRIMERRDLFRQHRDYVLKYYESHTIATSPYYYQPVEEEKEEEEQQQQQQSPHVLHMLVDAADDEAIVVGGGDSGSNSSSNHKQPILSPVLTPEEIERDRRRQAQRGYEVMDEQYRYATIDEYKELPTRPLARQDEDVSFSVEDLRTIIQHGWDRSKALRPPEQYTWKTDVLLRALLNAFGTEQKATQTLSCIADENIQILERDNALPVLNALLNTPTACEKVRESARELLYSQIAVHCASFNLPEGLHAAMQPLDDFMLPL
jgi:hypothetical protein